MGAGRIGTITGVALSRDPREARGHRQGRPSSGVAAGPPAHRAPVTAMPPRPRSCRHGQNPACPLCQRLADELEPVQGEKQGPPRLLPAAGASRGISCHRPCLGTAPSPNNQLDRDGMRATASRPYAAFGAWPPDPAEAQFALAMMAAYVDTERRWSAGQGRPRRITASAGITVGVPEAPTVVLSGRQDIQELTVCLHYSCMSPRLMTSRAGVVASTRRTTISGKSSQPSLSRQDI